MWGGSLVVSRRGWGAGGLGAVLLEGWWMDEGAAGVDGVASEGRV